VQVIAIDGPKITIMPKHDDLKDPLEFQSNEIKKYFRQVLRRISNDFRLRPSLQGDHVRVIGGRYEGDTGLIVRVEENLIVLFSDLTMHELKTMPKDLQLCTDMVSAAFYVENVIHVLR
jgi:transcription elongation factor SPT5